MVSKVKQLLFLLKIILLQKIRLKVGQMKGISPMSMLMRSISGIRGVVGDTLNPQVMTKYTNAFIQVTKAKKIVIGRDSRPTGEHYERIVASACEAMGVDVIMLGISSTPTVEMAVVKEGADGGIVITASHNPVEWNALKLLKHDGTFLVQEEIEQLFDIVDNGESVWTDYTRLGTSSHSTDTDAYHIQKTLELPFIDLELIKSKKFKVAFDGVNAAGSYIIPALLKELGCETYSIYTEPDGTFPRGPEPTPENLTDLEVLVKANGCAVGFATDPDADRCALVSEKGRAVGEEYTLAIATDLVCTHKKGPVTVNLSTSRMNNDIAAKHGRELIRSKVGEINVSTAMKANGSAIGGEGNGGVILPDLHYGRDAIVSVALVLQWMAENDKTIEDFVASTPAYVMAKHKIARPEGSIQEIYDSLAETFKDQNLDTQDGVWIDHGNAWVHVRASNTEPILRLMSEAPTAEQAEALCKQIEEAM